MGPESSSEPMILKHVLKSLTFSGETREKELIGRLGKLASRKVLGGKLVAYLRDNPNLAEKHFVDELDECGDALRFRRFEDVSLPIKLSGLIACNKFWLCPLCASRRASRHVQKLEQKLDQAGDDLGGHFYFFTLTSRNSPDLKSHVEKVWKCWSQLVKNRKRATYVSQWWHGGFARMEIKRGSGSGLWHSHLHGIVHSSSGNQDRQFRRLRKEWAKLLGQETANIHFRPMLMDELGRMRIVEAVKYAVKFDGEKPEETWHVYKTFENSRIHMLRTFGSIYGKLPDELTDDLTGDERLRFFDQWYRFIAGKYYEREYERISA